MKSTHSHTLRPNKLLIVQLILAGVLLIMSARAKAQGIKVTAYLKYNSMKTFDTLALNYIDELIYKLIRPKADGGLELLSTTEQDLTLLNRLRKKYPKLKLLIGVGGAKTNSKHFPEMAASPVSRKSFAENLVEFCLHNKLQGADIDWEYPEEKDLENAGLLFGEVEKAFARNNLMLTGAFNYSKAQVRLLTQYFDSFDQIHLMVYEPLSEPDLSTYQEQLDYGLENIRETAIPKEKVLVGLPFFGRMSSTGATTTYRKLVDLYNPAPEQDSIDGYQFMGMKTIKNNLVTLKREGWRGVMFWELGYDTPINSSTSLLKTIDDNR